MHELTAAQADDLYELNHERAGGSLILTSNRAPQDWYPAVSPTPSSPNPSSTGSSNNSHQVFNERPQLPARTNDPAGRVTATRRETTE